MRLLLSSVSKASPASCELAPKRRLPEGSACRRVAVLNVFAKKSRKTPRRALATEAGDVMTKPKSLKKRLVEDPEFWEECKRVDEECALIEALVRARAAAKLMQAKVARRVGTIRSAIARLEGGRVSPSFATLRRSDWRAVDRGFGAGRRPRRVKLPAELVPRCSG